MSERIRLSPCPACDTAIPETSAVCPECGAKQPGRRVEAEQVSVDSLSAPMVRALLRQYLGCLGVVLLFVFGPALIVGLLAGDVLGALAWMLLIVGVVGLALTVWLIRLVRR